MARDKRDEPLWDPEDAHGIAGADTSYRWAHEWAFFLSILLGIAGVLALVGSVSPFSVVRLAGALGILSGVVTTRLFDRTSRTDRRTSLLWLGAAVAAPVAGAALWLSTA